MNRLQPGGRRSRVFACGCVAASWLSLVMLGNELSGGAFRSAIFYALPVCLMAWQSLTAAFVVAAVAVVAAWLCGALMTSRPDDSIAVVALVAFARLSAAGLITAAWARVARGRSLDE